ncbi:MAG: hypothetical protein M1831_000183 [Alyxoria varia]|nr:MAG: hypothetical protein M1831_000183 [Alyxoria varia]
MSQPLPEKLMTFYVNGNVERREIVPQYGYLFHGSSPLRGDVLGNTPPSVERQVTITTHKTMQEIHPHNEWYQEELNDNRLVSFMDLSARRKNPQHQSTDGRYMLLHHQITQKICEKERAAASLENRVNDMLLMCLAFLIALFSGKALDPGVGLTEPRESADSGGAKGGEDVEEPETSNDQSLKRGQELLEDWLNGKRTE